MGRSTKHPSTVPTIAPSPTPSTGQTFSPTVQQMVLSEPDGFRVILGRNELLMIAALFGVCFCSFCGLFIRMGRKLAEINNVQGRESDAMSEHQTQNVEDPIYGQDEVKSVGMKVVF